jgi:hypothetical protein
MMGVLQVHQSFPSDSGPVMYHLPHYGSRIKLTVLQINQQWLVEVGDWIDVCLLFIF